MDEHDKAFLPRGEFGRLLTVVRDAGYRCLGPRVRDGVIVYAEIEDAGDLPRGVRDEHSPGRYRLHDGDGKRWFSWAVGPQALKPLLFAAREELWRARSGGDGLEFAAADTPVRPTAVIGVRACDLAALRLQDAHFLHGAVRDPHYARRRAGLLLIAVHCTHPAATCFCASTGDGPRADAGFDLALSELDEGFVVEAGSERGRVLAERLRLATAAQEQIRRAAGEIDDAARRQHRSLPARNLRAALLANLEHPRWAETAARCLSCANCTSVCPTCFCHAEVEEPSVAGDGSVHYRQWDSCFTQGHSYMRGYVVRPDTRRRYRQWLVHKLGTWHDQYGRSGCVGCGRCISWCPAGIDLTEEAAAVCGALPDG